MSRLRVLHVTNAYPTTKYPAYGSFIRSQISGLSSFGVESDVLFINAKELGKKEYLKSILRIRKQISENNYKLIHCHHLYTAMAVLLACKNKALLTSFLSDGYKEIMLPGSDLYGKYLFSWVIKRSKGKIFKSSIPTELKEDKLSFYLPNGVDVDHFMPFKKKLAKDYLGLNRGKKYILFVSANDLHRKEKRYDIYRETIRILKETYHLEDIEELHMVRANYEDLPYYYNAAEVHLLVSDFEGSPNSVKECLSCGTKVVARDVGNVRAMIGGVSGCEVISGDDPDSFSIAVKKAIDSNVDQHYLREAIFDRRLDLNSKTIELFNIYNNIVSS